jgi:hypothetical protein
MPLPFTFLRFRILDLILVGVILVLLCYTWNNAPAFTMPIHPPDQKPNNASMTP